MSAHAKDDTIMDAADGIDSEGGTDAAINDGVLSIFDGDDAIACIEAGGDSTSVKTLPDTASPLFVNEDASIGRVDSGMISEGSVVSDEAIGGLGSGGGLTLATLNVTGPSCISGKV
jgi:hypothetical protein